MRNFAVIIFLILTVSGLAQENNHRWTKLDTRSGEQLWYDIAFTDSMVGNKFEVWILQVHTPPLRSEGIEGDVYRSKILYAVNLTSVRYGIMKLRYYDVKNTKLYSFDYDTPPPPTDDLRYPYPILAESPVYQVVKTIFGNKNNQIK
jgi:hypothetical protein